MRQAPKLYWPRLFVLWFLIFSGLCHAVHDAGRLQARSTITVNFDTTLTTTVSGTQPTTLVTSTSISLTGTSAIISYIQTAIPSDVRSQSSYGCFVNSEYSYYSTPAWYTSLPPEVQSYYSSVNQGNTAACTSPASSSTATSTQPQQGSSGGGLSTGAKVGIAVGAVGAVAALLSTLWSIFKGNPCGHSSAKATPDGPSQTPSKPMAPTSGPANPGAASPPPGYQSPTPMSQPQTPMWNGQPGSQPPPPWSGSAGNQVPHPWDGSAGDQASSPWNGTAGNQAPSTWDGNAGSQAPSPWNGVAGSQAPPMWDGSAGGQATPWNGVAGNQAPPTWDGNAGSQAPPPWNGTAGADAPSTSGNQAGSSWNGWAGSDGPPQQGPPFNGQAGSNGTNPNVPSWNGAAGGGGDWSGAAGGDPGIASQGGAGQIPFVPIVAGAYRRDRDRKKQQQQRTSSYTGSASNHSGHTSPALVSMSPPRSPINELAASGVSSHSPWEGFSNESVRAEMPSDSSPYYHEAHTDYAPMVAQTQGRSVSSQSIPRRPVGSRSSSGPHSYHGAGSPRPYVGSNSRQGSYNTPNRAVEAYSSPTRYRQADLQESGSNSIYESGSRTIHEADEIHMRQYRAP